MDVILIVLVLLLIFGGGFGYYNRANWGYGGGFVLVVYLLLGHRI